MSLTDLIDTDWVVHYFKGRQAIVKRLNALEDGSLAISVVTLAELYDGLYGSHDPRKREQDLLPSPAFQFFLVTGCRCLCRGNR